MLLLADSAISTRVQIVAILASGLLFIFILELVRRRRLAESYALLWLIAAAVLIVFAVWEGLLVDLADLVGIEVPSNALFAMAFGFVLVLLLSFSVAVSRLSRENRLLAQEVARLTEELRRPPDDRGPPS
jgi:hypothetical protein